jgi:hypothetical protein
VYAVRQEMKQVELGMGGREGRERREEKEGGERGDSANTFWLWDEKNE